MKIFSDDPILPYKTAKLKAFYTKSEIDGLFAIRGIKDTHWLWDPEHYEVFVQFKIVEKIDEVSLEVSAKVKAPAIWEPSGSRLYQSAFLAFTEYSQNFQIKSLL